MMSTGTLQGLRVALLVRAGMVIHGEAFTILKSFAYLMPSLIHLQNGEAVSHQSMMHSTPCLDLNFSFRQTIQRGLLTARKQQGVSEADHENGI